MKRVAHEEVAYDDDFEEEGYDTSESGSEPEEEEPEEEQDEPEPEMAIPLPSPLAAHSDFLTSGFCKHRAYEPGSHKRPQCTHKDKDTITMMHTETTYYIERATGRPIVRLWGVTDQGNSVCVQDATFRPYFYVKARDMVHALELSSAMERAYAIEYDSEKSPGHVRMGTYILKVEQLEGHSIMGWHCNRAREPLFKFTVALPAHVAKGRDWLEGTNRAVTPVRVPTFEGNVPFELRYMIDRDMHGCEWISVGGDSYKLEAPYAQRTSAQIEADIALPAGIRAARSKERGDLGEIRFLAYDIEVKRREAGFPTADRDPAIMICCALYIPGKKIVHRACFALRGGAEYGPIEGADVYVFDREVDMLLAFRQYAVECDPEAFTGWNANNFDMPYLTDRASMLGIGDQFFQMTRAKDSKLRIRESTFQSRAAGARSNKEVICEGRSDFDGMTFMLRGVMRKFRSYSLNAIAGDLLGEQKADVDYSQIPDLHDSKFSEDCTRLLYYCMRDTELVVTILDKQMAAVNCAEQARVTGVPFKWLLSRGQGVKIHSKLLRQKEKWEFVPSKAVKANQKVTGGGKVKDPIRGFYFWPLISLDFASLYPSIMQANNVCYSTKVSRKWAEANLRPDQYHVPYPSVDAPEPKRQKMSSDVKPNPLERFFGATKLAGPPKPKEKKKNVKERKREKAEEAVAGKEPDFVFVHSSLRRGILPSLLDDLLDARRAVRKQQESLDPKSFEWGVLESRQLALKVVCNSVYGFLKAHTVVDADLMDAVTSWGRNMLRIVTEVVETQFNKVEIVDWKACVAAGIDPQTVTVDTPGVPKRFAHGEIVYGDTDSVMVHFGPITLTDTVRVGKLIAAACTSKFQKPCKLEFEAIKLRSEYINKKRYMALQIESFIAGERMEDAIKRAKLYMKGLEAARRDNAKIGSTTQRKMAEMLLRTGDIEKTEQIVKDALAQLNRGKIDLSQLVITKGLSKTAEQYARGGTKQPHVALQEKMRNRAHITGEVVPSTGDRVPYIMICGPKKSKAWERVEHPVYAQKHRIPIDVDYYVHKQVWPAVMRILTGYHEPHRCTEIVSSMPISKRETLLAHKRIFAYSHDHMRVRKTTRVSQTDAVASSVLSRVVVGTACPGCRMRLVSANLPCATCDPVELEKQLVEAAEKSRIANREAWDTCRKCQGGNFEKVSCANMTCGNFFHRTAVTMEMEEHESALADYHRRNGEGQ